MKIGKLFVVCCLLLVALLGLRVFRLPVLSLSSECDQPAASIPREKWDVCREEYEKEAQLLASANVTNKEELAKLQKQLTSLSQKIKALGNQIITLEKDIQNREVDLGLQQELLSVRVRSFYIKSRYASPLLILFSSRTAAQLTHELALRQSVVNQDKALIFSFAQKISQLKQDKEVVQKNKSSFLTLEKQVDEKAKFLAGEVKKTESYLAVLTVKQQEILAAKSGSFTASVGDSELADDYNASIKGFRESAPSGSFAVFSFGAYTHRKGMSQYGARGRAQSGQDYKAILKAYYGKEPVSKDTGGNINVSGFGSMNFEEKYLYGIAEMPSGWHPEVLKAQAIAARTYAYRYKQNGQTICTTETCQVFSKSKSDNSPQAWKDAVNSTRGLIIEDVVTFYASTHGGFITTMGWDTTDGGGGSNFVDKSYDKLGGSPWVYKAWYTQGYSPSSDKCGRANPWLSGEEIADIVNAALVLSKGSSEEAARVTPASFCWGGNPYSREELRNIASKYGGISSASNAVVAQGNGSTNQVTINGVVLSGTDFKKGFNLRAPGRLSIPQSGFAFFNIEKK